MSSNQSSVIPRARRRACQRTSTSCARLARKDSLADDSDTHQCDFAGVRLGRLRGIACDDVTSNARRSRVERASRKAHRALVLYTTTIHLTASRLARVVVSFSTVSNVDVEMRLNRTVSRAASARRLRRTRHRVAAVTTACATTSARDHP